MTLPDPNPAPGLCPAPPTPRYPRTPAVIVLLLASALGAGVMALSGTVTQGRSGVPLAELERAIAHSDADATAWYAYAGKLEELRQFDHAAQAYQRVLELEPYHRQAKLHAALVLAQLGDAERYLAYLSNLTIADPKLAADIFARPESQGYLSQPRFAALAREARSQAMD